MKRFITSVFLTILVLATMLLSVEAKIFNDTQEHWAKQSIDTWSDYGVINGADSKNFKPDKTITRAEIAAIISRLLALQNSSDISNYNDIKGSEWYVDTLSKCVGAGILNGSGEKLDPNGKVTREMFCTILCRALYIEEEQELNVSFKDIGDISPWAKGYVYALINQGYINGVNPGILAPKADINRASVITLIDRIIGAYSIEDDREISAKNNGVAIINSTNNTIPQGFSGKIIIVENGSVISLKGIDPDTEIIIIGRDVTLNDTTEDLRVINTLEDNVHTVTYKNLKGATVLEEYTQFSENKGLDLPENLTLNGYKFEGWYTEPEGGKKVIYIPRGTTTDYVVYAHWSLIPYTITYNNAPKNKNPITYTAENEIVLSDPDWSGMQFAGWLVKNEESGTQEKISTIKKGTTGNLTLTAQWKLKQNNAVPKTGNTPLLSEIDKPNGKYYFIYELGTIQNVVLDDLKPSGSEQSYDLYNKTTDADRTLTIRQSISISNGRAEDISKTVANSVTQTNDWNQANEWAIANSTSKNFSMSKELGVEAKELISAKVGKSYSVGTTSETSKKFASSFGGSNSFNNSDSLAISSTVEYVSVIGRDKEVSVTISSEMPDGFYAYVHAGNIKVYAVVIYDVTNDEYMISTFSALDNTYELLLYARDANELNSQECEALDFDIPKDKIKQLAESAYYIDYKLMSQDTTMAMPAEVINPNSNGFNYTGSEILSFKDPTRSPYDKFLGWYADANFTTPVNDEWINNWYANPSNITIYAKWDLAIYYNTLEGTPQLRPIGDRTIAVVDWSAYTGYNDYSIAIDPDKDGKRTDGSNCNLDVAHGITEAYFVGNPSANFDNVIIYCCNFSRGEKLTLHFNNFKFNGHIGSWYVDSFRDDGVELTIDCEGTSTLNAINNTGINMENVIFTGNGIFNVYGKNGSHAKNYGENGTPGYAAMTITNITIDMLGELNAYGGDGGNGKEGASGNNASSYDRSATSGKDGGHGGNGGDAISTQRINLVTKNIHLYGGKGGDGGNGGNGGNGKSETSGAPVNWHKTPGNGGNAGRGGNGGNGGNTGISFDLYNGSCGGKGGKFGKAGSSGKAGHFYWVPWIGKTQNWYGNPGADNISGTPGSTGKGN